MRDLARPFLIASGKLQVICYKEEIETALRTFGMGGFELLDLHDFPGQGTALVGVLDAFWDEKGYVTAAEYSRFCNSTVPLARLAKRVFTAAETLNADFEVAHFGPAPLTNVVPSWSLIADDGNSVASATLPSQTIPVGNGFNLGSIHLNLSSIPTPARHRLVLELAGTPFTNDWDVWVYPSKLPTEPSDKPIVSEWMTPAIFEQLTNGAKVLLTLPASEPRPTRVLEHILEYGLHPGATTNYARNSLRSRSSPIQIFPDRLAQQLAVVVSPHRSGSHGSEWHAIGSEPPRSRDR